MLLLPELQSGNRNQALILFENLFKPRQLPSATSKQYFELTSSVLSTTSKHYFEQPTVNFLVCSLIFIEYQLGNIGYTFFFLRKYGIIESKNFERKKKMNLKDYIATIENYPKEGITFRDISPLMADGNAYSYAVREIVQYATDKKIDMIVGPEARGFIVGCPVAFELGIGFAPVRKPGKLPREVISADYEKEYGVDTLTMHADAIKPGQRVLIVDDLLATGGTVKATIEMIEKLGGVVAGCAFLVELDELNGREKIGDYDYKVLMHY